MIKLILSNFAHQQWPGRRGGQVVATPLSKVWVACGEHKQPLADYLAVRSFLKRVEPLGPV